jgi:hypothetical protein
MKIIIAIAILAYSFVGIQAQTFKPYANISYGIWGTDNQDNDPVITKLYNNSNFGVVWTNNVEIQVELGKIMNLRILKLTTDILDGRLTVGQGYLTGLDKSSSQGTDESFEASPASKPGGIFAGRRNQLTYSRNGLSVSMLEPVKVDPGSSGKFTKGLPKFVASYNATLGEFNLLPVIGYGYYWQGEGHYNSFLAGVNFENKSLVEMKGLIWYGQNPSDLGIFTIQSGITSMKENTTAYGGFLQVGGRGFTAGIGYTQNDQDKRAGTSFANYKIQHGSIIISPEVGYFWGEGYVTRNTLYFGAKISASISTLISQ